MTTGAARCSSVHTCTLTPVLPVCNRTIPVTLALKDPQHPDQDLGTLELAVTLTPKDSPIEERRDSAVRMLLMTSRSSVYRVRTNKPLGICLNLNVFSERCLNSYQLQNPELYFGLVWMSTECLYQIQQVQNVMLQSEKNLLLRSKLSGEHKLILRLQLIIIKNHLFFQTLKETERVKFLSSLITYSQSRLELKKILFFLESVNQNILKVESAAFDCCSLLHNIHIGPLLLAQHQQKYRSMYLYCLYLHSKLRSNITFVLMISR